MNIRYESSIEKGIVNSNGRTLIIMGNIMEHIINDIWTGQIRKIQKLMLEKGRGNISICKFCIQPEI